MSCDIFIFQVYLKKTYLYLIFYEVWLKKMKYIYEVYTHVYINLYTYIHVYIHTHTHTRMYFIN